MTQKENIRKATEKDFPIVYEFVKALWTYNTYEEVTVREVYQKILEDENSFAWLYEENGICRGFCHGDYFQTFWMSGLTCYVSSLFTREEDRGKGYGKKLLDFVSNEARERGCKAITLDSGLPRTAAHGFYEHYGFEKSCYGFELLL